MGRLNFKRRYLKKGVDRRPLITKSEGILYMSYPFQTTVRKQKIIIRIFVEENTRNQTVRGLQILGMIIALLCVESAAVSIMKAYISLELKTL